jgi:hypothetical protein
MVRTNALFRSVRLVPGEHAIEFSYRPRTFFWGAAASGVAGALLILILIVPARRFTALAD